LQTELPSIVAVKKWVSREEQLVSQVRMFPVRDRSAQTLIPINEENVHPDAVIYTDGWRGYNSLAARGYQHRIVIHEGGFSRGLDTTNGIESCWSQVKRLSDFYRGIKAREPGALGRVQDHVNHGVWLRHIRHNNVILELIDVVNDQFTRN